jgi:hypothetical protein
MCPEGSGEDPSEARRCHGVLCGGGALWTVLGVLLYFPGFKYRDRTAARGDFDLRSRIFPLGQKTAP